MITEIFWRIFWHNNWRSLIVVVENFRFWVAKVTNQSDKKQYTKQPVNNDGLLSFLDIDIGKVSMWFVHIIQIAQTIFYEIDM